MEIQMKFKQLVIIGTGAAFLAACSGIGSGYEPVVDGVKDAKYYSDLAACQQLSQSSSYVSNKNTALTAGGAAVGGLVKSKGDRNDLAKGAAVGAAAGAATAGLLTTAEKQKVVRNCMINRGHKVVN